MIKRRTLVSSTLACVVVGVVGLVRVMEQPWFRSYHNADVFQLIASGMCFGVALSGVLSLMRRAKSS
jgi:hypothetical protein